MQARLQTNRFPRFFAVILFALTAAVVLGGALGYTLRSNGAGPGTSQTTIQQDSSSGSSAGGSVWGQSHKPY